jgi:hypothetical protein
MLNNLRFVAAFFWLTPLGGGCESPEMDLPPISWEGKNIVFGTTESTLPCMGTLAAMDRAVDELNAQFATTLPPGKKVHFYWMHNQMSKTPCREDMAGCASVINSEMYAFVDQMDAAEHEIVHLLLWPFGVGHKLFIEGLAECFGGIFHDDPISWTHSRETVESLLATDLDDTVRYRYAGIFVCYLAAQFGIEKIKETAFKSRPDWKWNDFNRGFKAVLGVSFDDVVDRFAADTEGCYAIPLGCAYPNVAKIDSQTWQQDVNIDCKNTTTQGSTGNTLRGAGQNPQDFAILHSHYLIDIDAPGYYRICVTTKNYHPCTPEVISIGAPSPSDAAQRKYSATDRSLATHLNIDLTTAQCSAGPGCPWPSAMTIPPGVDHTIFLEQGTFKFTLGFTDEDPAIIDRTEQPTIEIHACAGEQKSFPEECKTTKDLTCGPNECRACDSLIQGEPIEPPAHGATEDAACFLCRCLP